MALTSDCVRRLLDPIRRKLRLIVSRAILTAPADDSRGCQRIDIALLADEERTAVERVQNYGLTSVPPEGAEAACLSIGGVREHMIAVAVDAPANRPTGLKTGEVALWTAKHGPRVWLTDDGHVNLGSQPSDYVALASLVKNELASIKADLDRLSSEAKSHSHASNGATSTTAPLLQLGWDPGDVAAEEVKAK